MDMDREYHVWAGMGVKTFMRVLVNDSSIRTYGDRDAVALAAWDKLMGRNRLGEDINKKVPTRWFLRMECLSRGLNGGEMEAFNIFKDKIKFQLVTRV